MNTPSREHWREDAECDAPTKSVHPTRRRYRFLAAGALMMIAPVASAGAELLYFDWTVTGGYFAYVAYGLLFGAAWPAWSMLAWYGVRGMGSLRRRAAVCLAATAVVSGVWLAVGWLLAFDWLDVPRHEYAGYFQVLFLGPLVAIVAIALHVAVAARDRVSSASGSWNRGVSIGGLLCFTAVIAGAVRWMQVQDEEIITWRLVALFAPAASVCALSTHIVTTRVFTGVNAVASSVCLTLATLTLLPLGAMFGAHPGAGANLFGSLLTFKGTLVLTHGAILLAAVKMIGRAP